MTKLEKIEELAKELGDRRAMDGSPFECGLQNQAHSDARAIRAILAEVEEHPFNLLDDAIFYLDRIEDESGVSGTGRVAQGFIFDDGTVALRWLTENRSTALYASIRVVEAIHGNNGKTKITLTSPARTEGLLYQCPKCGSTKAEQIPPFHYCSKTGHHEQMSRVAAHSPQQGEGR